VNSIYSGYESAVRVDEVALSFHELYDLGTGVVAHKWYEIVNVGYALCAHFA
jgi:hypothetical protein